MKRSMVPVALFVLLTALSFLANAFGGNLPSGNAAFSPDNFDWREMMPYLIAAAGLPQEQGLKMILENAKPLRAYVGSEVRAECRAGNDLLKNGRCDSSRPGFTVDGEVTRRIDGVITENLRHERKSVFVDYAFERRPFVFSDISALRSDKKKDAYLVLEFADHVYTAAQVQAKYGVPYDTDVFDRYSVYKYRLVGAHYTGRAVFEINPVDGAVMKLAISVKIKRGQ